MIKYFLILFLSGFTVFAQKPGFKKINGKVTFVTPQNVYVKFENTSGIQQGDTVFIYKSGKALPAVSVKYVSSMSCAGPKFKDINLKIGDDVFTRIKIESAETTEKKIAGSERDTNLTEPGKSIIAGEGKFKPEGKKSRLSGSFTANSYSNYTNFTNTPALQRWNYILNVKAERIAGTPLTFSNYMNMSYLTSEWGNVRSNIFNNLRVYDFSLGYNTNEVNIWLGRHINYSIANLGPIDGIQGDKRFGKFALGGVVGSRPDFYSMGFNFKYFEYGAYLGRTDTAGAGLMQNTLAVFQQNYNNKTDRRFLYFQHNNNIFSDLYLFASSEIDLFKLKNGKPANDFSLTSFYLSAQYSPFSELSLNLSYDARKSVVYYQTFRSFIDSLFENEMRQGLRMNVFIRPLRGMFINAGGGYSYQKGDLRPTRNFNISLSQSEIPLLFISVTLSANRILGNYQNGTIYGFSVSKFIPFNTTTVTAGFSDVTYNFGNAAFRLKQKQLNVQLSTAIIESLFFNLYYEGDFDGTTTFNRFLSGITFRFR